MNTEQTIFFQLGVALVIGLLIGVERGWQRREAREGQRIAGVRTYGLTGLLGGCSALLAGLVGPYVIGLVFIGMVGVFTAVYIANLRQGEGLDVSITGVVAALLVFILGALAVSGMEEIAVAVGVVALLLLEYKPLLHRWVNALEESELRAASKLLLISAVVLPLLPDRGFGPWQALNPYAMWWMVVLVAAISFIGYFALKLGGARKGAVLTGLASGLVSSTALTLSFSRLARHEAALTPALATGILLACGTMLPRMLLVASLINRDIFNALWPAATVMAVLVYLPALYYWFTANFNQPEPRTQLRNPLELKTALGFGLLLALILLLGRALQEWLGETGVLLLAAASGVADVDAITLSLARLSQNGLALQVAAYGIVIAAAVNSLVKAGIATAIGGWGIGLRVGVPLLLSAAAGIGVSLGIA
ncbi:MgtC/SapB family protein [Thiothrix nivea]|uniref:Uncharacterized protein n=1 Tax=Thiothrix nivea (strain ATCC 35100 / DSM 5205 / JP2) TaxID=870187 RepID=A0A656HD74_THINJ|nr:MgtC/SapB family protein [Thiothrix nivea]EIJ34367.1 hypothetical protein Thini_1786 [Thiothrix nivea DSM 5205]